jgi:hypothetical protein
MEEQFLLIKPVINSFAGSLGGPQKMRYLSFLKRIVKTNGTCDEIANCDHCPFFYPMQILINNDRHDHICNYILMNCKKDERDSFTLLCAEYMIAKLEGPTLDERSPF